MTKKKQTARRQNRLRPRSKPIWPRLIWGGATVIVIAALGFLIWNTIRPTPETSIPIPPGSEKHIPETTQPGPYTSNPPAGGVHFPSTFEEGFYDEEDLATLPQYPEGYLVHNLEHGYVIFWYNCALVSDSECTQLKDGIRSVMAGFNNNELIAFPWDSQDVPVAMTSWGKILKMDDFSPAQAQDFIRNNLNRSPEAATP